MKDFSTILQARTSRRQLLQGAALGAVASTLPLSFSGVSKTALASMKKDFSLPLPSVPKGLSNNLLMAQGYRAQTLMRWGDSLFSDAPFAPLSLTAEIQKRSFGFNNDFIAYLPFDGSSDHGLLHVNHEYTNTKLMFPGGREGNELDAHQIQVEMQAHGTSTLEVKKDDDQQWNVVLGSRFARRITATTPIRIAGPAAGSDRMKTKADPSGKKVLGTIGNCAGGVTPWGTVLTSEENIDGYFKGKVSGREAVNHRRYTIGKKTYYRWHKIDSRFDVKRTPHEPNRFGWVVEYNPYDPDSEPVKRTALGRFKHESATCAIGKDGRLVVYSGDDDYYEYIYRYVSNDKIDSVRDKSSLLDDGTLFVAKFHENGKLEWIPLIQGKHGLTVENGFVTQADVLIEARRAGDIVGATRMDRPEGIAVHPQTQNVYVSLTKNPNRAETNAANPREFNRAGHILKMLPPAGDHAADMFAWDVFILAGDPDSDQPRYGGRVGKNQWLGCPDNLAFHPSGSLWIATDGMQEAYGVGEGLYGVEVDNAQPYCLLRAPIGAEVTGPCFTPDGKTLFVAIQHPGEGSSYEAPNTRWPDFDPNLPPRPSVIAVTRDHEKREKE